MKDFIKDYGTLISISAGIAVAYVQYKWDQRNRRLWSAQSLRSEIENTYTIRLKFTPPGSRPNFLKKAEDNERFVVWDGKDQYPIYRSGETKLYLFSSDVTKRVMRFYDYDAELRAMMFATATENFSRLPDAKRVDHINEIFDFMEGDYRVAKDDALASLLVYG